MNELIAKTHHYTQDADVDKIVAVAKLTQQILDEIIAGIRPGISESEATDWAQQVFKSNGIQKLWHRPLIRFNENTLCNFMDRPTKNHTLQQDDIAFVDIGIVKDGIEGDAGKTITFGENKLFQHLKHASEIIFQEALQFWRDNNPTGVELYHYIASRAEKLGVVLNLDSAGHLIGAFPHTHAWTKGANHFPEQLVAGGWILEIQIRSPNAPFGAFYEDILFPLNPTH